VGDPNGKSDPYCVISLLDTKGKEIIKFNTTKKNRTLSPVWNESFSFPLASCHDHVLQIEVLDKDLFSSDPLGLLTIPLNQIATRQAEALANGRSAAQETFYDLRAQGEISLVAYFPSPGINDKLIQLPMTETVSSKLLEGPAQALSGNLSVRVISAKDLRNVIKGNMSCYARLAFHHQKFQTKVHTNGGLHARWNEHFVFHLSHTSDLDHITIEVLHEHLKVCNRNIALRELIAIIDQGPTAFKFMNHDNSDCDGKVTFEVTFENNQETSSPAPSTTQTPSSLSESTTIPLPPHIEKKQVLASGEHSSNPGIPERLKGSIGLGFGDLSEADSDLDSLDLGDDTDVKITNQKENQHENNTSKPAPAPATTDESFFGLTDDEIHFSSDDDQHEGEDNKHEEIVLPEGDISLVLSQGEELDELHISTTDHDNDDDHSDVSFGLDDELDLDF